MAKRTYQLEQTPEQQAASAKALEMAQANASRYLAGADVAPALSDGFEDLSLPPIIKYKGLKAGDTIIGEVDTFGEYNDDKISSALITVHILRMNPETKELQRVGLRAALPVGAVLQRSLGAGDLGPKATPAEINEKLQANGYGKGAIIAMEYCGTGKERKTNNAPHLWNIKAKRADGSVTPKMGIDHGNKKKK